MLILSPHLDDAVLSCPAYLQRLANDGIAAVAATIFTEGDASASTLYQRRREEDCVALGELGASARHLGLLDAPFRSPTYRDFCGIIFGTAREYGTTLRLVAQEIGSLIAGMRPLRVITPMAAGNHVDHRIVRDAALLTVPAEKLLFYEDRPYSFVRGQVEQVRGKSAMLISEQFWRSYFTATYVRKYRGSATDEQIVSGWNSVAPFPDKYRLRKFAIRSVTGSLARTLVAISCYRSQLPDLFADDWEIMRLYQRTPENYYRVYAK